MIMYNAGLDTCSVRVYACTALKKICAWFHEDRMMSSCNFIGHLVVSFQKYNAMHAAPIE